MEASREREADAVIAALIFMERIMKVKLIRLTSYEDAMYTQAMELYRNSFPSHEQRKDASQKAALGAAEYHFDLIYDGNVFVGMLLYWETKDFLYVEHFCVKPELRGKSYGQKALEELGKKRKRVILEIDPPTDEISIRRKGFYERAGYWENSFRHIHPPYHAENQGHPLVVMSCPDLLDQAAYEDFYHYLKCKVMAI